MKKFLLLTAALLSFNSYITNAIAADDYAQTKSLSERFFSTGEDRLVDASIIVGSFSKHLTDDFEPTSGYNETHQSLGIDIEKNAKNGFIPGVTLFSFKDSFDNSSFVALGTLAYKKTFHPTFSIKGGLAAGLVDTSYYSGAVASPFVEACYYFVCPQLSYFPKLSGRADSFLALQLKFKVLGGPYK